MYGNIYLFLDICVYLKVSIENNYIHHMLCTTWSVWLKGVTTWTWALRANPPAWRTQTLSLWWRFSQHILSLRYPISAEPRVCRCLVILPLLQILVATHCPLGSNLTPEKHLVIALQPHKLSSAQLRGTPEELAFFLQLGLRLAFLLAAGGDSPVAPSSICPH